MNTASHRKYTRTFDSYTYFCLCYAFPFLSFFCYDTRTGKLYRATISYGSNVLHVGSERHCDVNRSVAPDAVSRLVGRKREQEILRERFAAATANQGSLVLITGDAGVGKTALVAAFAQEAAVQNARVLTGRCYEATQPPPYSLWLDLFEHYPVTAPVPPPAAFFAPGVLGSIANSATLMGQMREWLLALSAHAPLVLILEDLHWADSASLDLLPALARALPHLPVLVLATYRENELNREHPLASSLPHLVRETDAIRLALLPLTADDLRALVQMRYGIPVTEAERLATYLGSRAEGNAFFTVELLHTLEETGAVRQMAGEWAVSELTAAPVPPLLRQVVNARVARLGAEASALLEVAAIIGGDVPVPLWAWVSERDEEAMLRVADIAIAAHLLQPAAESGTVSFAHALVREALYTGIALVRRRALHGRVGEAFAALHNPDPDTVAYHFGQAGDARAAAWFEQAGERAYHAYAWETAAARFETALTLRARVGVSAEERALWLLRLARLHRYVAPRQALRYLEGAMTLATEREDDLFVAFLRYQHGLLRCSVGELRAGMREATVGMAAIHAIPPARIATRVAAVTGTAVGAGLFGLETPAVQGGAMMTWSAHIGQYPVVLARAEEWAQLGELPPSIGASGYADGWLALGEAWAATGQVARADAAFERALARYRQVSHYHQIAETLRWRLLFVMLPYHTERHDERQRLMAELGAVVARAHHAIGERSVMLLHATLCLGEGRWDEVLAGSAEATDGSPLDRDMTPILGRLFLARGEQARAWAQVYAALPEGDATEPGDVAFHTGIRCQEVAVELALATGDRPAARQWLEAHDGWLAWSGATLWQSEGQALWACYYRQGGDATAAWTYGQTALARATEPCQPLALLTAHRLCGELTIDAGQYGDARTYLDVTLALADTCAVPYERALTLIALAGLHRATNARADADAALAEAQAICIRLGARPALDRIAAFTDYPHTGSATRDIMRDLRLTKREYEVLVLLAEGSTNTAIADALSLSPRTVERHIANLYAKIGAHTRAEAVAFAARHGLGQTAP